jgi:predicted DNA-binding protein (MmcQ/YjbR family)
MNIEEIRDYCLSKNAVTESTPFDDVTLVFKVAGKMFGIVPMDETELKITLKCDPDLAIQLREEFPCVRPGYHTSKKHWNTIAIDGSVGKEKIIEWIDHSYAMVVKGLPAGLRSEHNLVIPQP